MRTMRGLNLLFHTMSRCALLALLGGGCTGDDGRVGDADADSDSDTGTGSATEPPCDADGDGHDSIDCGGEDCDDENAEAHPGAKDTFGDGVDQDCDRLDGVDVDQDGYASEPSGGDDCDDGRAEIHPDAIEAGEWRIETADAEGNVGAFASLELDASDHAHMAYMDLDLFELQYTTNASGAWVSAVVECGGICGDSDRFMVGNGWNASLGLGTDGDIYISFDYDWSRKVYVASNQTGFWASGAVDADEPGAFSQSLHTSLAVEVRPGEDDVVHVAYYAPPIGELHYATNAGGAWAVTVVDTGEAETDEVGLYASLAVDPDGAVHITYHDQTRGDLRHATNASGAWEWEVVDEAGDTGTYTSLAVDADGALHVAHHVRTDGDLRYSTNASGAWVTVPVDTRGTTGTYASLALDDAGAAHISYFDSGRGDLRYTTNASGVFYAQTVDEMGTTGLYTSIAIDSGELPHIAYYDASHSDLRYAVATPDAVDQNCDGVPW